MTFEIGKIYTVNHSRKGIFTMRVTSQTDEWATGILIDSKTKALMDYNVLESGEEVTARKSFIRNATELVTP